MMDIASRFQAFHQAFPFFELDALIEYFSFFGGIEGEEGFALFGGVETTVELQILKQFDVACGWVEPSYLMEEPYRSFLVAVARGDGKMHNVFRRARMHGALGGQILSELERLGIVWIEPSRESPVLRRHGQQLPRELRGYRIQSKIRFARPFDRFWFGFVAPYYRELEQGDHRRFLVDLRRHHHRAPSWVFEQLSHAVLERVFAPIDPIVSMGSWWDRRSEYDVMAITRSGRMILGECKYKRRKVTKGELTKLREKAHNTGFAVDTFALFSRNGFSRELREAAGEGLRLFEIKDFGVLVSP
jgi:hypothetical protein